MTFWWKKITITYFATYLNSMILKMPIYLKHKLALQTNANKRMCISIICLCDENLYYIEKGKHIFGHAFTINKRMFICCYTFPHITVFTELRAHG